MKKLLAFGLAAVLACGFCGCANEESSSQTSSAPQSVSTAVSSETSVKETANGDFDWDKAMSDFYIDDKKMIKMKYPFSESVLGENFIFEVDESQYTSGDEYGDGWLTVVVNHKDYNGWWLFKAQYKGITKDEYKPDLAPDKIYTISGPIVQGIKEGTSMENVYALWGKPDKIEEGVISSPRTKVFYYGKENGQRLCLRYDHTTNKVESISFEFN